MHQWSDLSIRWQRRIHRNLPKHILGYSCAWNRVPQNGTPSSQALVPFITNSLFPYQAWNTELCALEGAVPDCLSTLSADSQDQSWFTRPYKKRAGLPYPRYGEEAHLREQNLKHRIGVGWGAEFVNFLNLLYNF